MATPTEAESQADLQNAVDAVWNQWNQQTAVADTEAFTAALDSDYLAQLTVAAATFRSGVASSVRLGADMIAWAVRSYVLHQVNRRVGSIDVAFDRLYDHFVTNNIQVTSRGFTFGSPAAGGGNTGDGVVKRLTVDENGFDLENAFPNQDFELTCVRDAQSGRNKFEERFQFETSRAGIDLLDLNGAGVDLANFDAVCSRQSLLGNPTFSQYSFATAPTAGSPSTGVSGDSITNWTPTTAITSFQLDIDVYSHAVVGDTTPTSVRFLGNDRLTQALSVRNVNINPNRPYYLECFVKREDSCDGTFTIALGSTTKALTVSTLTSTLTTANTNWTRHALDLDENLWPAIWNETAADVYLDLSSRTTGSLAVDEVRLVQMRPVAGAYYVLSSGVTAFLLDDSFTWSDSVSSDSKIQFLCWLLFGRMLPHRPDATQVTASGGRTLTFADADPDTITASSGSFVTDGYYAGMTLTVAGTSSNNGSYKIATVSALVITLDAAETLAAEGPLSATATLDATAQIADPA